MWKLFFIFVVVSSCASNSPTPYRSQKKDQLGYKLTKMGDISVVTFRGNKHTTLKRSRKYAEFRAIEECRKESKLANILDIFDKTVAKEVQRSSGTGLSHTYWGPYPYYSRYSNFGFGFGPGFSAFGTNTWTETLTYPTVEVLFNCSKKVFRPLLLFREIPAKDIKHLVKDVRGAIQVEKVKKNSPNKNDIEFGDIILKANGKRIEKVYQLISLFNEENQNMPALLLREGNRQVISLSSQEVTEEVIEEEKKIISYVCSFKDKNNQEELKKSPLCNT